MLMLKETRFVLHCSSLGGAYTSIPVQEAFRVADLSLTFATEFTEASNAGHVVCTHFHHDRNTGDTSAQGAIASKAVRPLGWLHSVHIDISVRSINAE
jgi:hypothetical protein